MNVRTPPFNIHKVRQAVSLVLDQQEMIDIGYEGAGFKSDFTGPIGMTWSLPQEVVQRFPIIRGVTDADRAMARRLLAEAGFPEGLEVEFLIPDLYERFSVVTMEQLRRIGIRTRGRLRAYATEWIPETREGKFAITYGAIPQPFYDPALALAIFTIGHAENRSGYNNPKVDELHRELARLLDPAHRKRLADEIQIILWQDLPLTPSPTILYLHAARPEVRGWTHPGLLRDNLRFEYIWLAR